MEMIWGKVVDIFTKVADNPVGSFIISVLTSYVKTMKMLVENTFKEDWDVQNDDVIVVIAGLLGVFGLLIAFGCIRIILKFLVWLLSVNPTNLYYADDLSEKCLNRSQHNNSSQTWIKSSESRRWFKQAMCDLKSARNDIDGDRPAPEWVCYKCQQVRNCPFG